MDEIKRIYSLLLQSNGLKIRAISNKLDLDKYYVANILFSPQNTSYWFQDDDSLWYAKTGALNIEEQNEKITKQILSTKKVLKYNINRFLYNNASNSIIKYLHQISKYTIYSNEEIIELFKIYKKGDNKAYELIIKSQQRFITNIAFLYSRNGISIEDLIQEGNIGLIKAIQHFDYTTHYSFINYAKTWILQSICASFYMIKLPIRIPCNQLNLYHKISRLKDKYEQILEFTPSVNEIDINEDIDFEWIEYVYNLPDDLYTLVNSCGNMDNYENKFSLAILYEDKEYNKEITKIVLNYLDTRSKEIVKSFYGIDTTEESLASIAEKEKITRERVRQILLNSIHYLQENINSIKNGSKLKNIRILSKNEIVKVINGKKDSTPISLKSKGKSITKNPVYTPLYNITNKRNYNSPKSSLEHKSDKISKTNKIILQNIELKESNGFKIGEHIYYNNIPCTINRITKNKNLVKLYIEYDNGIKDVVSYNGTSFTKTKKHRLKH